MSYGLRATPREEFLLGLLSDRGPAEGVAAAERARVRAGGAADYLPILSPELRTRCVEVLGLDAQAIYRDSAPLYQLLGSYNPFHVGHRVMISAVMQACEPARISVSTHGVRATKGLSTESYGRRHWDVARAIALTPSMRATSASAVDLPTGVGYCVDEMQQPRLLASLAEDSFVRVVIGSDTFLSEMRTYHDRSAALSSREWLHRRYGGQNWIFIVLLRVEDEPGEVNALIERYADGLVSQVRLIPNIGYHPAPASSSRIRALRISADPDDWDLADLLQHGDVNRDGQLVRNDAVVAQRLSYTAMWPVYEPAHGCIRFPLTSDDSQPESLPRQVVPSFTNLHRP